MGAQVSLKSAQYRRFCIFCESGTGNSKEHVFSGWTAKLFPIRQSKHYRYSVDVKFGDGGIAERIKKARGHQGDALGTKVHGTCVDCNNRWMSQIDNAASRLASPMIDLYPIELNRDEQTTLSAWVTLKSLVAALMGKGGEFPKSCYVDFFNSKSTPVGSRILVTAFNGTRYKTPMQLTTWYFDEATKATLFGVCTLLCWKHLFLAHCWSASPDRSMFLPENIESRFTQLFPVRAERFCFPDGAWIDDRWFEELEKSLPYVDFLST